MSGHIASTKSTGGGGFVFEARVAAHYMTLMLSAQCPFAPELGLLTGIGFQTGRAGWSLDDILLTLVDQGGATHRVALSVKSNVQFTGRKAPQDFVQEAWEQYLHEGTSVFDMEQDRLGLVTTRLPTTLRGDVDDVLAIAQRQSAAEVPTAISSKTKRTLFESFACPEDLADKHQVKPGEQGRLISRLEFPEFDFESPSSSDESAAVRACLSLLYEPDNAEAIKLWERLCSVADEYRITEGATLDRRRLVAELQGFRLKEHPIYRRDWEILAANAKDTLATIPSTIGDIHVPRTGLLDELRNLVDGNAYVAIVGPSGCGKSALVKEFAEEHLAGQTVLCWHASILDDVPDYAAFENGLGLQHRLNELLPNVSSSMPVLVIDGLDRIYQDKAYRALASLIRNLGSQGPDNRWRVVVTCQSEEWERALRKLRDVNMSGLAWQRLSVDDLKPDTEDMSTLWNRYPSLDTLFRQERLRPVLCKPVVLNALAVNVANLDDERAKTWRGESDVIDWFWENVIRARDPEAIRSEMLMVLGEKQADRLEYDVPERELPNLEHLRDLKQDGLCVGRPSDRVTFRHDVYGDWARLRRLVQAGQNAVPFIKQRVESPMWHRAIKLYGLRTLEQNGNLDEWLRLFRELDEAGQAVLLDAAILASNATVVLEKLSPVLLDNDGSLLPILLGRFLHVATLPDPRMQAMAEHEGWGAHETAAEFRLPDWPLWPAMISFLHKHREKVVDIVAGNVSAIADKWLRETPVGFSWRKEAAELGVLIAERLLHDEPVVGTQVGDYRSGLAAAHEFPDRVAAFALEAAGRIETASANRRFWSRRRRRLRACAEPWPDGPRASVDIDFQELCLSPSGMALYPLINSNPGVAREVVLALLISQREESDDPYDDTRYPLDELQIEHIHGCFPPIYLRGPFLDFLRSQPDEGLDLIIRLVDFVTDRWADRFERRGMEPPALNIELTDGNTEWLGDDEVYRWHLGLGYCPYPVACALMALEKWLYEKSDAAEPLDDVISTIHARSHSLALIRVLCALGQKQPKLFAGPLLPYLGVPELHDWEAANSSDPSWAVAQIGWGGQPQWLTKLAADWYNAPHRSHGMDHWADILFHNDEHVRNYLQSAAQKCRRRMQDTTDQDTRVWLELFLYRFDVANWHRVTDENGDAYVVCRQPAELQTQYAPMLQELGEQSRLGNFVIKCRQVLDEQMLLRETDLEQFWQELQAVSLIAAREQPEPLLFSNRAARCAGATVLIEHHLNWLEDRPERLAWCRNQLTESVLNPPDAADDDMKEFGGDNWTWDRFCSRAMPTLWQQQLDSAELRRCVALLATGTHTRSIGALFWSASRYRAVLNDSFRQLQHLLLRYASVRHLRDPRYICYSEYFDWEQWRREWVDAFVAGTIPPCNPSWADIIREEHVPSDRFKDVKEACARLMGDDIGTPPKPAFDTLLVAAAYSWLPSLSQALYDHERAEWIGFWKQFLDYSLENHADANLPYEADRWVLGRLPGVISEMRSLENPGSLWKPILALSVDAEHWVEVFLNDWFACGLGSPEISDGFTREWIAMLEFGFSSERWDVGNGRYYLTTSLWTHLMGLMASTQDVGPWTDAKANLVLRMRTYYERWCSVFLRYGHCAQRYAAFLAQPAAGPIRVSSLAWLQSGANACGDHWWRERDLADSLARLLVVVWEHHQPELKQHQQAFAAFMGFLAKLTAQLNPIALQLESRA